MGDTEQPKSDHGVLEADIEEAIKTGRLPKDPDRREAVLWMAEMAKVLRSFIGDQPNGTDRTQSRKEPSRHHQCN